MMKWWLFLTAIAMAMASASSANAQTLEERAAALVRQQATLVALIATEQERSRRVAAYPFTSARASQ